METRDKQITYAVNRQGGIYLIHNSHTFWRSKPMANDNFRWRCSRSLDYGGRCKSRLVTGSEDQLMEVSEHNHDANVPALIAKLQATSQPSLPSYKPMKLLSMQSKIRASTHIKSLPNLKTKIATIWKLLWKSHPCGPLSKPSIRQEPKPRLYKTNWSRVNESSESRKSRMNPLKVENSLLKSTLTLIIFITFTKF